MLEGNRQHALVEIAQNRLDAKREVTILLRGREGGYMIKELRYLPQPEGMLIAKIVTDYELYVHRDDLIGVITD